MNEKYTPSIHYSVARFYFVDKPKTSYYRQISFKIKSYKGLRESSDVIITSSFIQRKYIHKFIVEMKYKSQNSMKKIIISYTDICGKIMPQKSHTPLLIY